MEKKETWWEVFSYDEEGFTQTVVSFDTEKEALEYIHNHPEDGLDCDEWFFNEDTEENQKVNWTVEKKDKIESILIDMWVSIGIDIPDNYEDIVQDCYEDVCETADPHNWHSGDVAIAFRRWIEKQTN